MSDATKKQLKLKTGACKRNVKELLSYQKEEQSERAKLKSMEEEGADEGRIKQQLNVVNETTAMIPNCRNRSERTFTDLKSFVEAHQHDEGIAGSEDLQQAQAALGEAKTVLGC